MKKITFLLFVLYATSFTKKAEAQDYMPFLNDNYNGVTGIMLNPANIADNRLKFDMTFIGFGSSITNNYLKVRGKLLFDAMDPDIELSTPDDYYFREKLNGKPKKALINTQIQALNFMLSLSDKHSVAFSARMRGIINANRLPEEFANILYQNKDFNPFDYPELHYKDINFQFNTWAEYGLTYARVMFDSDHEHFFKLGGTVKLIQGLYGGYGYINNLDYKISELDTTSYFNSKTSYGISDNTDLDGFKFGSNPTVGLDLGIVYEWRPNHSDFKYDMDGERDLWRQDLNKYKLKIGFSILDLGRVKYKKGSDSEDFVVNVDAYNTDANKYDNWSDFVTKILDSMNTKSTGEQYFNMALPTVITAQVDYHVMSKFYLNCTPYLSLRQGTADKEKTHYLSNFIVTPRWEDKWYGASMPFHMNQFGQLAVGLGLRAGPVWIGSKNLLGSIGLTKWSYGPDVHVLVKIPFFYKEPKDKDKDQVSDGVDECKDTPGMWKFKGCPDSDNDGIRDTDDKCPYKAGLKEFGGCPDTDKDGVEDRFDECPDVYGSKLFAGCPDTDKDNIPDKDDDCPEEAGPEVFNGCPDYDKDSIPDKDDDCPEDFGPAKFNGCPDTDGDGIRDMEDECPDEAGLDSLNGCPYVDSDNDGLQDKYDKCPKLAGPIENSGCPYVDTDNDGVLDKDDWCPMTAGIPENNGCPEIEEEEQEILNTAFDNLEFQTAKSVIKSSSFASLDELAGLMVKKPEFRLLIEGHTDNVGNDAANMALSKNRADAVKKYLTSKGVEKSRMTVKWYGETKPIAPNDTEEGRQKNRRVEMKVLFD